MRILNGEKSMNDIEKLIKLGFEKVGHWVLDKDDPKSGLDYHLTKFHKDRVIYAFTTANEVLYVGICASKTTEFKNRLYRYKNQTGNGTNKKNTIEIKSILKKGFKVDILAFNPNEKHHVKINGIEVDLVKGLEPGIIDYVESKLNERK